MHEPRQRAQTAEHTQVSDHLLDLEDDPKLPQEKKSAAQDSLTPNSHCLANDFDPRHTLGEGAQ